MPVLNRFLLPNGEFFFNVIEKAKEACKNAENDIEDHFVGVNKTIPMPKGASKEISDIAPIKNQQGVYYLEYSFLHLNYSRHLPTPFSSFH